MVITDYKTVKASGNGNVKVSLINGTPALTIKKYNPDTGELLNNVDELGIDINALKAQAENLQSQIDNINELIKDAKALTPK